MATATEKDIAGQVAAYRRADAAVRAAILTFVARAWENLQQYRDDDIDRWVAAITPVITGGLMQVAALTDAHLANVLATMTGSLAKPLGVSPRDVTVGALRGAGAAEAYRRAGETVWAELSRGTNLVDAAGRGLDRATRMAQTDLQLAKTHTARRVLSSDRRVVGYRRVTDGDPCKLCATASTQRYRTSALMPIHSRCSCSVLPIVGDLDPGRVIDPDRLARLKADDTKVAVHEHGEIGPVLTDASHSFAGG